MASVDVLSSSLIPDWTLNDDEVSLGTSLCAAEFDGGVIMGADSRTSMGTYVSNRVTNKVTKVCDNIYCCRSGSAADTQAIADIVTYQLNFLKMETGEDPTVQTAAHLFKDICYKYRDRLSAGILCGGWDKQKGGQVYAIPLGGMCQRLPLATAGSGSTYIYGFVDAHFRRGMAVDECHDVVKQALSLAIHRDGSSGGVIRTVIVTKDGCKRSLFTGADIPKVHYD